MTLNEAIWETVLILPPPQPWGVIGRGGVFLLPFVIREVLGPGRGAAGLVLGLCASPQSPPSAVLYLQFGTLGSISAGNTDDRLDDRWQLAIRYSC